MNYRFKNIFNYFTRYSEAGFLLESFLVSAVSAILFIRFVLNLTGYPQIGGEGLHIAHMLWGGLLMLAAILVLLVFLGKEAKQLAAIVGGVGFGIFIDELGKFITSDNNYFFQPTISIIYIIFIILFLLARAAERTRKLTDREYLVNALELTKEVVSHDFDKSEKRKVLSFLNKSNSEEKIVKVLKKAIEDIDDFEEEDENIIDRTKDTLYDFYRDLVENRWFARVVIGFFVVISLYDIFQASLYIFSGFNYSFVQWGRIISAVLGGMFVLLGIYFYKESRFDAYSMFKRSVLTSIFLTQVFLFYTNQFSALVGLAFNIIILIVLQYLLTEEKLAEKKSEKL